MIDVATSLPEDPDELRAFTALLLAEVRSQATLIEKLRHQLAGYRSQRYGSSSETIEQLQLALETSEIATAAMTARLRLPEEDPPEEDSKDKPKRRAIPDHIPRQQIELTTGDDACAQCGGKLRRLGEDVTEELEYVPGRFIVNRITRPRFACSGCDHFTQAPLPSRPIERGRPGTRPFGPCPRQQVRRSLAALSPEPGLWARRARSRSLDTGRLGRQVDGPLLEPLANAIGRHVLNGEAIFADDTPVKMLAPGTGKTRTARLWVYGRDERPWGSDSPPAAWYQFSDNRKGQNPKEHLKGYRGWMHADGFAGFEDLYRSGDIREVACMAHIRRKFVDIHKAQGSSLAEEAIKRIAELYSIEKKARGSPPQDRCAVRRAEAKPRLDDLEIWLHAQLPKISGKSPLAKAIRYALTRMARLRPYLDNGRLELDNNTAERAMRSIALGRKNYLFVGSQNGGKAAAIAYTLIETAKLNGIDPHHWLANTIARIPDYKITKVDDLLPWNAK